MNKKHGFRGVVSKELRGGKEIQNIEKFNDDARRMTHGTTAEQQQHSRQARDTNPHTCIHSFMC